jgi:hypothetical protein
MVATSHFFIIGTTFAEEPQTGKSLVRKEMRGRAVVFVSLFFLPLSLAWMPNHFFFCLFVFLDFLPIWGQLILSETDARYYFLLHI